MGSEERVAGAGTAAAGFGPLRRNDRAVTDRAAIDAILAATPVMHLALADGGRPLVLPLFFAYLDGAIYFHSARAGTKMDLLRRNPKVCFEISVDHGAIEDPVACDFEARHRTAIGFGQATEVRDDAEKTRALDAIVARFTTRSFTYPPDRLRQTAVVKIEIQSITGKAFGV